MDHAEVALEGYRGITMVTDTDHTDGRDGSIPAGADGSAAPGAVLTLAQAADRLHLRPSLLRRLLLQGTLLPDDLSADGQPHDAPQRARRSVPRCGVSSRVCSRDQGRRAWRPQSRGAADSHGGPREVDAVTPHGRVTVR